MQPWLTSKPFPQLNDISLGSFEASFPPRGVHGVGAIASSPFPGTGASSVISAQNSYASSKDDAVETLNRLSAWLLTSQERTSCSLPNAANAGSSRFTRRQLALDNVTSAQDNDTGRSFFTDHSLENLDEAESSSRAVDDPLGLILPGLGSKGPGKGLSTIPQPKNNGALGPGPDMDMSDGEGGDEADGDDDDEGDNEEDGEDDDWDGDGRGGRRRTRASSRAKPMAKAKPSSSSRPSSDASMDTSAAPSSGPVPGPPVVAKGRPMPEQVRRVLLGWFLAHSTHPFPSPAEKKSLMAATGLTAVQIRNWLVNQRKRHWRPTMMGREPRCKFDAALAHMAGLASPGAAGALASSPASSASSAPAPVPAPAGSGSRGASAGARAGR